MKLQHHKEDIPNNERENNFMTNNTPIPHPIVNQTSSSNSSLESTAVSNLSSSNVSFLYQYFVFMSYILGQSPVYKTIFLIDQ